MPTLQSFHSGDLARPTLLFLPAMGVPVSYYQPFLDRLQAAGARVRPMDLPGQGSSPLRARRGDDYGYREVVEELVPQTVRTARAEWPQAPLFLVGHSLGGQLAVLACAEVADSIQGLAVIAAGTAHWRSWPARSRWRAALTIHALSLLARVLPFYPGSRIGFGGDQSRRFMRDWSFNARTGAYRLEGGRVDRHTRESALRGVRLPVLALSIAGDAVAPGGALRELLGLLPAAEVTHACSRGDAAQGAWRRHFTWARQAAGIEEKLLAWLAVQADRSPLLTHAES
jgi:predicted alpha/beta hydrolase